MRRSAFGFDALFVLACVLYAASRACALPMWGASFLRGHFADCLLIPAALPPVLWLQHQLRLRRHARAPEAGEILLHVAVWSVAAELIAPRLGTATGDFRDVLAYAGGATIAWWWWSGGSDSASLPASR